MTTHGSLKEMGKVRGIYPPTEGTLKKYGLTDVEWLGILCRQNWQCPICLKRTGVRWVIDHKHVPGWKNQSPEERRYQVRGILCSWCNHRRVHSNLNATEARRIADYIEAFEQRQADDT